MHLKTNIKEAGRSLYGAKQRTLLALIGIIIGIGSVIAMVSIGKIVEAETLRQFKDMGTDILTIRKSIGMGPSGSRQGGFRLEDVMALPMECSSVAQVAPYIASSFQIRFSGKGDYGPVLGVTESFLDLNKIEVREGRFVSDLDTHRFFCVLGEEQLGKLRRHGLRDPIGKKIKIGDHIFTIIGTLDRVPQGGMRPFGINEGVMIPITSLTRIAQRSMLSDMMARTRPGVHHTAAKAEVESFFRKRTRSGGVDIFSAEELIERMEKQMQLFTLLLGAVGSISLIVGGVGVMNVMLVSVTERRKEIGIRRALGAKRRDIQGQFLIESIILSIVGGIFGILLGIASSYLISRFSHWEFLLAGEAILLGVGVSTGVGIFFGFYPARQASRLDPILALRSD